MSNLTDIRDAVYTQLLLDRTNTVFTNNLFLAEKTYLPQASLASLAVDAPDGKVYVVTAAHGDVSTISRSDRPVKQELAVQFAFQKTNIDYSDTSAMDLLVELVEEFYTMCRKRVDLEGYSWSRIEVMKNEKDVPFSYTMLREARTFEAYFTSVYNLVIS